MNIPYRTRQALKRAGIFLLVMVLIAALVWACWFIWLDRYLIYTRDRGAVVDMSLSAELAQGNLALPPEAAEDIHVYYNEGNHLEQTNAELTQLMGYYVEPEALTDLTSVSTQLQQLPEGSAVLIDVKNIQGQFYYSSGVSTQRASSVDISAMDSLISYMNSRSDLYTIARLPAFRDYHYGLNNVPNGLFHSSRQYLWMDDDNCYWLNPASEGTFTYLVQIVNELQSLGFDEVVFSDFRFPDTTSIYFDGDKTQALADTAEKLVSTCATDRFAVSFTATSASFALPEGRCRMYLQNVAAADVADVAGQTGLATPEIHLVFLTGVHDTRFDAYSVLRPLSTAH